MPAYDFRCTSCGTTFEVVRSISDTSAIPCIECGAETKRVFTPVGVHFKGSGFYNTDSRKQPTSDASAGSQTAQEPASSTGSCDAAGSSSACEGCPSASS